MIRVLIADDHEVVRDGLKLILETEDDFKVVGEAGDGAKAVQLTEELQPDVILMDLRMPGMDGLQAIEKIHSMWPKIAVVILTTYNEDNLMIRGLRAGARGYINKHEPSDRLLAAMEELGLLPKVRTAAPVLIAYFDKDRLDDYLRLAAMIRGAGIGVEVYPEPKKLGQQLQYADKRGFRVALIAGSREFDAGVCQVKDLQTGTAQDVPLASGAEVPLVAAIQKLLPTA